MLYFDRERCKGCELCIVACPRKLLGLSDEINAAGYHPATLNKPERCNDCTLCARFCPDLVITVTAG